MTTYAWTQCPDCGWTGRTSELDTEKGGHSCPACAATIPIE